MLTSMAKDLSSGQDTREQRRVGRIGPLGVHVAVGVFCGGAAQLADGFAPWSSALTSHGGIWLAALVVLGLAAPTPGEAAERTVALLVGVLVGYYAASAIDYGYAPRLRLVLFWAVLGISAAPAAAALARRLSETGLRAAAVGGLLGGGLLAEALLVAFANPSDRRWSVVWFDVVAGLVLLASVATRTRRPLTVLAVAAGAAALGVGALVLLTEVYRLV